MGYWPLKNESHDHRAKGKFVSLTKPIVLCTNGKRISSWSIFAIGPIADICPFLGYWPYVCDHDVKGICFSCNTYSIWYRWEHNFTYIIFVKITYGWILTPRPLKGSLLNSRFSRCRFKISKSYMRFKIWSSKDWKQLSRTVLWNTFSATAIKIFEKFLWKSSFFSKVSVNCAKNEFLHRFSSSVSTTSVKQHRYRKVICRTLIFVEHVSMAKNQNIWKCTCIVFWVFLYEHIY